MTKSDEKIFFSFLEGFLSEADKFSAPLQIYLGSNLHVLLNTIDKEFFDFCNCFCIRV